MKVVVFGPTGATGRAVIEQGLAAGHQVTAFTRSNVASASAALRVVKGDVYDAPQVTAAIRDKDAIISCLGTRPWRSRVDVCSEGIRSILTGMKETGVRRLIAMSSQGVGDSRFSFLGRIAAALVLRRLQADKEVMEKLLAASDVDWTAVRPGILTNFKAKGRVRAADDGSIVGGFIARADVAAFMLQQLSSTEWVRKHPVIVGS